MAAILLLTLLGVSAYILLAQKLNVRFPPLAATLCQATRGLPRLVSSFHSLCLQCRTRGLSHYFAYRKPVRCNLTSGRRFHAAAPQSRFRRVWLR